ncbi:CDP-diacylglycerol--inositol 3-phosphatidyltransferase [Purpureocillium lilacinum]|uniref:CDP-diacylglycerol--inositol 3-phosphatidyltransferase n=2 Tax=Purpureocillium lilacinum TaxID=33203 RepID=A0A179HEJ1_PURLI|nr:CDP-diacylglycerol--inositol 3-phosphatidyltransferase [Purpureocillium lilacinum]OAQ80151.1 CDP-diacylglycerol--inositol 3-phosphatidyltransferase [Purpureocillium lilacinum]OAQ88444.1 CDP-diacylglycerol--inositol 3-phosphatidyltransferase [Purpureocillium lilacinum]
MPARQTRRKTAAAAAAAKARDTPSSSDEDVRASPMNGSAVVHSASSEKSDAEPKENIFLFWPNVIGYWRIVLAIASLYYMPLHPRTCSLLYSISCLLDALDGYAARIFEQSTRFGAVLDMVTDRCTTSCLLVFLSSAFPRWAIIFQSLIALDFSSHYMHMYATLVVGGADSSHKNIDKSQSRLLNLYYSNKNVLFVFCALNELFFIALYLLSFSSPLLSPHLIKSVEESSGGFIQPGAPVNASLLRQLFPDPFSAAALEIARANKMDSNIPWALAGLSFPVMAMKQFINVVQLVKASKSLAEVDIKSRKAKGLPRKVKAG